MTMPQTGPVATPRFTLHSLDQYKLTPFPPGYPATVRTFFAPVDGIHNVLTDLLNSATKSLVLAMYAFDDAKLAGLIKTKLTDPNCFVQLTLDSSQAAGPYEQKILASEAYPASSIAIGKSEKNAIMHLKMMIIDGVYLVTGSTNWSSSAQFAQDNQLTVIQNAYVCAEARARVDAIHANMLAHPVTPPPAPVPPTIPPPSLC